MAERTKYHVTKRPDGRWQGKAEGNSKASVVKDTKADTMKRTREIARRKGNSQLFEHGRDGKFQNEFTYDDDPHPPKG